MPAWSFQRRFRERLLNGLAEAEGRPPPYPEVPPKRQTIRAPRRDGRDPEPGQRVRLWIRQRTPEREFLGVTPRLRRRDGLEIDRLGLVWLERHSAPRLFSKGASTRLARDDGFASLEDLLAWIDAVHGLPFHGYRFRW